MARTAPRQWRAPHLASEATDRAIEADRRLLIVELDERVRGRYFRENFAQGGLELVQVIPELVTNADAAINAAGRSHGRIRLSLGPPDPAFLRSWREQTRRLRVPALRSWTTELRCTDDGIGVDAETIDGRLGALGVAPDHTGQRGLFGRGLREGRREFRALERAARRGGLSKRRVRVNGSIFSVQIYN